MPRMIKFGSATLVGSGVVVAVGGGVLVLVGGGVKVKVKVGVGAFGSAVACTTFTSTPNMLSFLVVSAITLSASAITCKCSAPGCEM